MLRKRLMPVVIGALLGVIVELAPVVVEAQQPLRVDSEQDVVEVSRQVVGAESLTAPPVQEGESTLWVAVCASGLGIFGGWLLWGKRHEPEVVTHQFQSIELVEDWELPTISTGSVLGLTGEQVDPTPQNLMGLSRVGRSQVVQIKQPAVESGDYTTPLNQSEPVQLPTVFEDPEPQYHAHPMRWYEDPEPVDHCFPQAFKSVSSKLRWPQPVMHRALMVKQPAATPVEWPPLEHSGSEAERFNDWGFPRQNVGGVELVDLDPTDIPWELEPVSVPTRHRRESAMANR